MQLNLKKITLTFLGVFYLFLARAENELSLAGIFTDHMVLQRNASINVWGKSTGKSDITLKLNNQKYIAKVKNGHWLITLSPMKAGGPYTLKVSDNQSKVIISDILIGDVWLAGGQSNMEFPLRRVQDAETEISRANYPEIRYYKAPRKIYSGQVIGEQSWKILSPETAGEISAIAYYFATGLNRELNIPVGIVQCPFGGTTAEAWISRKKLLSNKDFKPIIERYDSLISAYKPGEYDSLYNDFKGKTEYYEDSLRKGFKKAVKPIEPIGELNFRRPYTLFDNMIQPLMPFTLKGFIFYQGESNTARGYQYRKLFPALIEEWRKGFGQGDLPFLFIQLPKFETKSREWAEVREAQSLTEKKVKNTGMVVAYDQGNPKDIHPVVKRIVGYRLTQLALGKIYGKNIVYSGPVFKTMKRIGNTIEITFINIGSGLTTSDGKEKVLGFTVSDKDRKFQEAKARIIDNKIILTCDAVQHPVAVRYAWANSMEINLINKEAFPASPFRTDKFKLISFNIK